MHPLLTGHLIQPACMAANDSCNCTVRSRALPCSSQSPMLAHPAAKPYMDSFEVFDYNMVLSKQKLEDRKGDAMVDEDGFMRMVSR